MYKILNKKLLNLPDNSSPVKIAFSFIFKPYTLRVRLGEGGLVVFNLAHSIYAFRSAQVLLMELIISFFVLCAMYGYNDYHDRYRDILNAKKNKGFVSEIMQNPQIFAGLNLLLVMSTIVAAFFLLDAQKALWIAALYLVNFLYSSKLKEIPVIDIIIVSCWGGLYSMISGSFHLYLILTCGVMTGIAHLFQMITDESADKLAKVNTSVVAFAGRKLIMIGCCCILLGLLLYLSLGAMWAVTGILPLMIFGLSKQTTLSWYISRVYFFVCWIALLNVFYGSI